MRRGRSETGADSRPAAGRAGPAARRRGARTGGFGNTRFRYLRRVYDGEYIVHDGGKDVSPFVYFVVQKVGCSSVKKALAPLFGLDPKAASGRSSGPGVDPEVRRAMDLHDVYGDSPVQIPKPTLLQGLAEGRYERHLKFAFVRDPYDRLLSCYLQKLAPGGAQGLSRYDFGGVRLRKGMSFADFVRAVREIPDGLADAHFRSQHLTTHDEDARLLADFVGRFENLGADFGLVSGRLGLDAKLPHLLRSDGRAGRSFYDPETRNLARERYARDLDVFGYAREA